jgi:hypothetical protein
MFKQATKEKFRFSTGRGNITVEDLWDLPLNEIDVLAKKLNREVKDSAEESFIAKRTAETKRLEARFEIVKAVIKERLEDIEVQESRVREKAKKERILSIIADKEDEELAGKSVEELKGMAEKL